MQPVNGFTFWLGKADYFYQADDKKMTNNLAIRILNALGIEISDANISEMRYRLKPCTLETKCIKNQIWYSCKGRGKYKFMFCGIMEKDSEVFKVIKIEGR